MKKLIIFANMCFFLVVCLASFCQSAPIPDLKGVWTGTATAAWGRADLSTPVTQKFMDYAVTITITDQNQDLFLGTIEASLIGAPPGDPIQSADFAGVVYGNNELHFFAGRQQGAVGFGKLSLRSPVGTKNKTISGHWVGPCDYAIPSIHGTAARFSVTKKPVIPPPTEGGK